MDKEIKRRFLLDLCVSSLRRGHANLLCIVPNLTDDLFRDSESALLFANLKISMFSTIVGFKKMSTKTGSISKFQKRSTNEGENEGTLKFPQSESQGERTAYLKKKIASLRKESMAVGQRRRRR